MSQCKNISNTSKGNWTDLGYSKVFTAQRKFFLTLVRKKIFILIQKTNLQMKKIYFIDQEKKLF